MLSESEFSIAHGRGRGSVVQSESHGGDSSQAGSWSILTSMILSK